MLPAQLGQRSTSSTTLLPVSVTATEPGSPRPRMPSPPPVGGQFSVGEGGSVFCTGADSPLARAKPTSRVDRLTPPRLPFDSSWMVQRRRRQRSRPARVAWRGATKPSRSRLPKPRGRPASGSVSSPRTGSRPRARLERRAHQARLATKAARPSSTSSGARACRTPRTGRPSRAIQRKRGRPASDRRAVEHAARAPPGGVVRLQDPLLTYAW
jgi:hypothetical protein